MGGQQGNLYYFDDGGTPAAPTDDSWVLMGRMVHDMPIESFHPAPSGGLWIKARSDPGAPLSCKEDIYYSDMGDPSNAFDDRWMAYDFGRWGDCKSVYGLDGKGIVWLNSGSPNGGTPGFMLLDYNEIPLDEADDIWVSYTDEDGDLYHQTFTGFDPSGGVWSEGIYYDWGELLEDKTDDEWRPLDSFSASTMASDSVGGRWFGYRADNYANPGIAGALRYLDDGGTLRDTSDDAWTDFSVADGLLFDVINAIAVDSAGRKRIVSRKYGLESQLCSLDDNGTPAQKDDDIWTYYSTNDGLAGQEVYAIAVAPDAGLWIASSGGVNYLEVE